MSADHGCPPPTLKERDELHGFRITRVCEVPEIRATAYEAVHLATGAKFLHLHCDDRENLFTITFRTPPPDSTGVAHILEHSVLAGSEKYPVRDAFTELGKGSLKTFMNAFTASDFTCYPLASQVPADFYNLATVYTDLVFRPRLRRSTFMQEGHRLEVDEEGTLAISGIVYNEMKGAYSTAETVARRLSLQGLFPDTPNGFESGGHPRQIPDLTYEAFREFHRRYYSASNSRLFFYGNLPTAGHLEFLARVLQGLTRVEVDSTVPAQPRWSAPRTLTEAYPAGADDPLEKRSTVNIAWMTAPVQEAEQQLILMVLEEALIGNAAAPLRKALIDSGLGEDLSPSSGFDNWYKQAPFVVGLRGTDAAQAEAIEELTLSTLRTIARDGLPPDLIEGAFHQVEFKGLEITRKPLLFPLMLLFRCLGTWLHEEDPLAPLRFPSLIGGLRERWRAEPDLFRQGVQRWLVDNPHRLRAVVVPDRELAAQSEAELKAKLAARRAKMSAQEVEEIRRTAAALLEEQRAGEDPAALASLPVLRVEDIPPQIEIVPTVESRRQGAVCFEHDLFSNGVAYCDLAFDVSDVPEDLQMYLPLLGGAITGMGAAGMDYEAFATRKAMVTGEVSAELRARGRIDGKGTAQFLALRGRALLRNVPEMVAILRQILVSGDLTDRARLHDILAEQRNETRAAVAPSGHTFAARAACAGLTLAAYRDEIWHGVTQVGFASGLLRRFEGDAENIRASLEKLRAHLFRRGRVTVNLTGDHRSGGRAAGRPARRRSARGPERTPAGAHDRRHRHSRRGLLRRPHRAGAGAARPARTAALHPRLAPGAGRALPEDPGGRWRLRRLRGLPDHRTALDALLPRSEPGEDPPGLRRGGGGVPAGGSGLRDRAQGHPQRHQRPRSPAGRRHPRLRATRAAAHRFDRRPAPAVPRRTARGRRSVPARGRARGVAAGHARCHPGGLRPAGADRGGECGAGGEVRDGGAGLNEHRPSRACVRSPAAGGRDPTSKPWTAASPGRWTSRGGRRSLLREYPPPPGRTRVPAERRGRR